MVLGKNGLSLDDAANLIREDSFLQKVNENVNKNTPVVSYLLP